MSDRHEHHHHLHRHKEEKQREEPANYAYAQSAAPPQQDGSPAENVTSSTVAQDTQADAEKRAAHEKSQKRNQHLAEAGALASGAFALYEQHKVKVDPENKQRHRIEEGVAGAIALASGGFAVYEHHEVKTTNKDDPDASTEKHKHHFHN